MVRNGFSMIELLVALIIFSVGLLGTMALQTNSTAMGKSANDRLRALLLAQDMSERIQANPTEAVTGGAYDNVAADTAGTQKNCTTSSCSSSDIAGNDIYEWKQTLANQLPSGTGAITRQTSGSLQITVGWQNIGYSSTGRKSNIRNISINVGGGS